MDDDKWDLPDPRIRGINEQHHRAVWFINLCAKAGDATALFRLQFAALYPARAIVELMLDAAENQELPAYHNKDVKKARKQFEEVLSPRLTHYALIERIRIHDFHRSGCVPPDPKRVEMFFGGQMKLTASKGAAVLSIPSTGPKVTLTGNSSVKDQRSLCNVDGAFFDPVSDQYLPLHRVLVEYLKDVPDTIAWFEEQMAG
ncbi:MAG: hypothetical protein WD768_08345 [Phycisphaeraceae bacterium]